MRRLIRRRGRLFVRRGVGGRIRRGEKKFEISGNFWEKLGFWEILRPGEFFFFLKIRDFGKNWDFGNI